MADKLSRMRLNDLPHYERLPIHILSRYPEAESLQHKAHVGKGLMVALNGTYAGELVKEVLDDMEEEEFARMLGTRVVVGKECAGKDRYAQVSSVLGQSSVEEVAHGVLENTPAFSEMVRAIPKGIPKGIPKDTLVEPPRNVSGVERQDQSWAGLLLSLLAMATGLFLLEIKQHT